MSIKLSDRILSLSESQTIAFSRMSRELKEQGHDVISLSLGEPDFNTPDFIKAAGKQAMDDNLTSYPPVPGYAELRKAISAKFKRDNDLDYSPEQIVVSTGAKQSIANVVLSLAGPGDEVILLAPYWVSYLEVVKMAEAKPVIVSAGVEQDYKIRPEQLEAAITDKSKLLIFNSPSNPTGSVYSKDEIEALGAVIRKHPNLMAISDEIYELFNFQGQNASLAHCDGLYDQVITINGVSKAFAMTGWRIGYIGAPLAIAKACTKMQGQFTSGPSTISQKAAQAAIEADPSVVDEMKAAFIRRRKLVMDALREIDGFILNEPQGAFYVFPNIQALLGRSFKGRKLQTAHELCMYLLNEAHVATVPGEAFGAPECLRISYAASDEELKESMRRIKRAVEQLEG
jgi:aspartate aminotransferase